MKDDKLNALDLVQQHMNAADHIESDLAVSAPQFSPTAQLKPAEEEEEQLQLKKAPFQMKGEEEEESLQMKGGEEEEEELQMKKGSQKNESEKAPSSTKTSLPEEVQSKMEGAFGADFSNVNIHSNSSKAQGMGAQAYAQGNDVHFAPGKYNPESQSGQELLGHELTHVVQQRQGRVQPTTQMKGQNVNADQSLENEADHMGKKAASGVSTNMGRGNLTNTNDTLQGSFLDDPIGAIGEVVNGVKDAIGDATNTRENEAELDAKEDAAALAKEKQRFKSKTYGPQDLAHATSVGSGTGIGGFEATYYAWLSLMQIKVKGKINFLNGVNDNSGTISATHTNLSGLATYLNGLPAALRAKILPYYQWNDADKATYLAMYHQRLNETIQIWQGAGHHFEVGDPAWSDVKAYPFFNLQVTEEGTIDPAKDHLQVRIFRAPTDDQVAEINALLSAAGQADINARQGDLRAYAGTNMGSEGGGTDENAFNNEMALSSNDVHATANDGERGGNHFLKKSVMFDNGKSTLSASQKTSIRSFVRRVRNGDTLSENNAIKLIGYASASGSTEFNTSLTAKRIKSINDYLLSQGIPAARITTENKSDLEAETLGNDAATQDNERRVEIQIGSGERQNTIAHEFGHVFGLSDEYSEGTTRPPGLNAWHDKTVKEAGLPAGAQIENSDNIISTGNTVRPQHYATFAWALNQLTQSELGSKKWHVKT
ncbi:eCIS core domain-containing protein [Portibacter lacus]|uniref:OmpA-like domain-containing protein n=1 Tax=Portibacter lacus TaxID=1099794 RepID=A0AA37WEF7_9BACT|nr:DUF4157 domain-containing protein [Portibacter lacus]GLR16694.1 hypothetical protein GCM10007940_13090 [Portibacter lacus]